MEADLAPRHRCRSCEGTDHNGGSQYPNYTPRICGHHNNAQWNQTYDSTARLRVKGVRQHCTTHTLEGTGSDINENGMQVKNQVLMPGKMMFSG